MLGVPVIALEQLNRNRATHIDKRPQPAALRESWDLENAADSELGLYRDQIDHPDSNDRGLAELSVLKKRQLGEEVGIIRRMAMDWRKRQGFHLPVPSSSPST